jgi:hypothetical protein
MDSLYSPVFIEQRLKLEKEAIIQEFRKTHLSNGTRSGTVNAFMNLFSSDDVKDID